MIRKVVSQDKAHPLHSRYADPVVFPDVGNSAAQFVVVEDRIDTLPF